MKKYFKFSLALLVPLFAIFGIYDYYSILPIEGAYETNPVSYSKVNQVDLKERLSQLDTPSLEKMFSSGLEVLKWQDLLKKVDASIISELVPDSDPFYSKKHYPYDEVYDKDTSSLYYYHSHRPGEHGHFHLFFCDGEVLSQHTPLSKWDKKNSSVHLIAISIHPDGTPLGFFTVNQWITPKEWWYSGKDIADFIGHFEITHPYPSWPTNQWMNHMLKLFKPQIEDVLQARDEKLSNSSLPLEKALKNKKIEILSQVPICVETQLLTLEEILNERRSEQEATN